MPEKVRKNNEVDRFKFPFRIREIRTDKDHAFCPLLTCKGDVDLEEKLQEWAFL